MAKAKVAERGYRIVEHENPYGLPDLIIDVPDEDNINTSEWIASMRRALGKKYNVKFRIWDPVSAA